MTKKGNGIAIYAGIGAGIAVLILVIVAVVLIIKRRRKANSKQTRETAVPSVHENSADVYSEVYQLQGECEGSGGSGAADCLNRKNGTGDELGEL
ncbi:hypothetical protein EB796_012170 [Bugula neritina]|uniref:Uncharacterized protein n=1 Tax=Bugula neritina TaxID=10212 RepID=A0A7J7JU69_BUGNE|nr:hypothetical protein EB796_012170 [Bugula neritina]